MTTFPYCNIINLENLEFHLNFELILYSSVSHTMWKISRKIYGKFTEKLLKLKPDGFTLLTSVGFLFLFMSNRSLTTKSNLPYREKSF